MKEKPEWALLRKTHSFIQEIFTEHLLWVGHRAKLWGHSSKQDRGGPDLLELREGKADTSSQCDWELCTHRTSDYSAVDLSDFRSI